MRYSWRNHESTVSLWSRGWSYYRQIVLWLLDNSNPSNHHEIVNWLENTWHRWARSISWRRRANENMLTSIRLGDRAQDARLFRHWEPVRCSSYSAGKFIRRRSNEVRYWPLEPAYLRFPCIIRRLSTIYKFCKRQSLGRRGWHSESLQSTQLTHILLSLFFFFLPLVIWDSGAWLDLENCCET